MTNKYRAKWLNARFHALELETESKRNREKLLEVLDQKCAEDARFERRIAELEATVIVLCSVITARVDRDQHELWLHEFYPRADSERRGA